MVRVIIIALTLLCIGATPGYSQIFGGAGTRDRGEPIFTPLKNIRDRAENGVLSDKAKEIAGACKCKGKLFPEAACKRCQRQKANEEEKAKEEKAEEAELKKLEAEAKKAELEAQLLEEEEQKRNKPWDIADEENAELGDLLAMAAKVKKDQDLAPKKQQALDYLASLGCSKDPRVNAAIIVGLKDPNVEVRRTAVQTVIYAVQGSAGLEYPQQNEGYGYDPYIGYSQAGGCANGTCNTSSRNRQSRYCRICGPQAEPEDKDCPACDKAKQKKDAKAARKQQRDQRRKDRVCGCGNSNCSGCDAYAGMPCEVIGDAPCQACMGANGLMGPDGCGSCCDPKIREELRKMAFEPNPKQAGCYYEPSIEVRNLALQAYNLCPAQAKKDDPTPEPIKGTSEDKGNVESEGVSEGEGGGSDDDDSVEPELESPSSDSDDSDDSDFDGSNDNDSDSDSGDEAKSSDDATAQLNMLRGHITQFSQQGYSIRHSGDYHIPAGNLLYISTNANDGHIVEVVNSNAGMAQVKLVEGNFTGDSSAINIGVMR